MGSLDEQKINWSLCYEERLTFLKAHSILEYINLFPILRTQFGYELLLLDFNVAHEKKKDCLYAIWRHLSRAILLIGIEKKHLSEDLLENPLGKKFNLFIGLELEHNGTLAKF